MRNTLTLFLAVTLVLSASLIAKTPKILIVDNEPSIVALLERQIRSSIDRAEVITAFNYTDGLARYSESPDDFTLVLSDLEMGRDGSGLDLAHAIHAIGKGTRFILASGTIPGDEPGYSRIRAEHIKNIGVSDVLPKPFSLSTLVATLNRLGCLSELNKDNL